MVRILLTGDSHIPKRASTVPDEIYREINTLITTDRFDYVFFTGDLVDAPKLMTYLNNISRNKLFKVIGNMDYYGGNRNLPQTQNLAIDLNVAGEISLGLIHGHQVHPRGDHNQLELIAQENNYNILVSGHTHKEEIYLTPNGILLLNPGSITGAWSFIASGNCSFIVLSIKEHSNLIDVKLYQYNRKSTKLSRTEKSFQWIDEKKKIKS
ncbi:MAG: metallophosphoesterase [Promethearchaeota archaeon]|nr:MAG: metallophosphoesterase [Candidatus Lokiarchaeota archaeon]